MYYIYLLKSLISEKTYVGMTNEISRRIKEHNSGKSKFTNRYMPWKLIYSEEMNTREEARKREKYFKSAAGRKFLKIIMNKMPR
jgi:putative endonuclease